MSTRKDYLGDSVYADIVPVGVVLTTENGYGPSNIIVLEVDVLRALYRYVERNYAQGQVWPRSTEECDLPRLGAGVSPGATDAHGDDPVG